MQNLLETLKKVLEKDERCVVERKLLKNKIMELALKNDKEILGLLLSSKEIKKHFFTEVEKTQVFDREKFIKFVSNKQFLPDSYTAFKNKIGLTSNGQYLTESKDVVLAWPYKDCVLEGGQTKEDAKRDEVFHNEILAPDQIDRLLDPKVLTNFKKYDKDGEYKLIGDEKIDFEKENLIIKGNNLIALHTLKSRFAGKVKLIYIDPPYNTGNDSFNYNDSFNHSAWLTFMRNRLEIARETLSENGSIWINIDDNESHYLKVLCDEVFGRDNFVANVIWQKKYSPQNDAKYFSDMHDHILVFSKNKESFKRNLIPRTEEMDARYSNPDNDPRGDWKGSDFSVKTYSAQYDYPIKLPSGRTVNPPKSRCWRTSKEKFHKLVKDNRIWFGTDGNAVPSIKRFKSEVKNGTPPLTIWLYKEVGHNQDARKEIVALFNEKKADFSTPKPEKLLQRIIHIGSNKGDIVMDFFSGSGTTGAVAHKMARKYILVEQMDYVENITKQRLQKVIEGEQGGISKNVSWKSGGSFIYFELSQWNEMIIQKVKKAKNTKELLEIWEEMKKRSFLSYKIEPKDIDKNIKDLKNLSFENQKEFLIELLDKNYLYVPYSEIEDREYGVSEVDKRLNKRFYEK